MGPVLNTVIGAAIKIGANLVNFWLEQRRQDQLMLAARDNETLQSILKNQAEQAKDPFVKVTRRILFLSITFTMCFLMIFYALNPHITYDVIVPKGESAKWGISSWLLGAEEWSVVQMTGGLLLTSFFDLCFMVVGFYSIPSRRR
jgi:hypothetical protein